MQRSVARAVAFVALVIPGIAGAQTTGQSAAGKAVLEAPRNRATLAASTTRHRVGDGIWVDYGGQRWYSNGPAVPFDESRFVVIGSYRGFPVYHDSVGGGDGIWVRVVADGPVAPYARR